MPFVRLYSPKLPLAKRKQIVKEFTQVLLDALHLPPEAIDYCTIQFSPFKLDEMAVGGKLLSENRKKKERGADYTMEVHERNLDAEKRQALVTGLTGALARVLKIKPERIWSINILIQEYNPSTDFAVGGRFVGDAGGSEREADSGRQV
jgi:phenylpyruvate tautomerase PptA (4-oxalocrotonate tautomerase family)